jgi:hypothetical protein
MDVLAGYLHGVIHHIASWRGAMRCLIPALFLTLIVACRDVTPGLSDALVQDSAGIAMVENTTPAWRDGQAWRVEPKPVLQLGQLDGDQPHMFANITGAVQLADGSIAVADAGSSQLRIFDPTGQHRRSIGGPGSGPGEFRVIDRSRARRRRRN